jgi:hypothetical protein
MPNGKYEPQCGNCVEFVAERSARQNCKRYNFVMPAFSDYVVCADWRSVHSSKGATPFGKTLEGGFLYRWAEYSNEPPQKIGRFDEIQELLLDRSVTLVENPEHGWAIYIPQWDHQLYPQPGETISIGVDGAPSEFTMADIEVTVTYTHRDASGNSRMEDRTEIQLAALPSRDAKELLVQWIELHHGLDKARKSHEQNLANPRFLNKNKTLRLLERITGRPEGRVYFLKAGIGAPSLGS